MTVRRQLMLDRPAALDGAAAAADVEAMKDKDGWASADPLGEALHFLRMNGIFYCRSEFTAPWGLALPARHGCLSFHFVLSGRGVLEVEGAKSRTLRPGDLALVPHGKGHRLTHSAGARAA